MKLTPVLGALALATVLLAGLPIRANAQNTKADIANTRHNLSSSNELPSRTWNGESQPTVKSSATNQICIFCHTPHGASNTAQTPLWNRELPAGSTYTRYTSSSLDAAVLQAQFGEPGASSRICLSCHDGSLALGAVSNRPGTGTGGGTGNPFPMTNAGAGGVMPSTTAQTTAGYTRNLGKDLTNDHPISITYDSNLAARDGELRTPPYSVGGNTVVSKRTSTTKPHLPLDNNEQVQCTTCHDPHLAEPTNAALRPGKFLRLNRFQINTAPNTTGDFTAANDQICLGCHSRLGKSWAQSAHADTVAGNYTYTTAAAAYREFPSNIRVWQAACLNCHDTHTAPGARRLLRGGVSNGSAAQEKTCYQCHGATPIITVPTLAATTGVPNIETEFGRPITMPIAKTPETHDIGYAGVTDAFGLECSGSTNKCGADFIESRAKLGENNHANRHVECTDCHNPHRVIKNSLFTGKGTLQDGTTGNQRTHVAGGEKGNLASGALRGTWGVEPTWSPITNGWPELPSGYTVKRGDPTSELTDRAQTYLTREYQLCLKCHSNYGAGTSMPLMSNSSGGTSSNTNGMGDRWTNIAAEFSVAANDTGDGADQGAAGGTNGNKRSWHPVHFPTGRGPTQRGMGSSTTDTNILTPFATGMGDQTMHCSDCHGANGSWTAGTGPNLSTVQGPHGSDNNFLLKGTWVAGGGGTRTTPASPGVCGNCHSPTTTTSGFATGDASHSFNDKDGAGCTFCHVVIPHGWKNKAFLVNLACIGPESGESPAPSYDANKCVSKNAGYSVGPYYENARLRISSWAASGSWAAGNCSGVSWMQDNCGSW